MSENTESRGEPPPPAGEMRLEAATMSRLFERLAPQIAAWAAEERISPEGGALTMQFYAGFLSARLGVIVFPNARIEDGANALWQGYQRGKQELQEEIREATKQFQKLMKDDPPTETPQ